MNSSSRKTGFTLLEIVVSITLLALIALMLVRVFNESNKTIGRGQSDNLLDETAIFLLETFQHDISQALIRTNVAFRVSPSDRNGSLYFISPAIRDFQQSIGRDTAPIRIASHATPNEPFETVNRSLTLETADKASDQSAQTRRNLMHHSDYYYSAASQLIADFGEGAGQVYPTDLLQAADNTLDEYAVLTFLDITVNADSSWDYSNVDEPSDPEKTPRFVDLSFGLIPASEMRTALIKNSTQHIEKNERIYSQRIHLKTFPPELLIQNDKP